MLTLPPKYGKPNAVYPCSLAAFKLVHSVVDDTTIGAVPVATVDENWLVVNIRPSTLNFAPVTAPLQKFPIPTLPECEILMDSK